MSAAARRAALAGLICAAVTLLLAPTRAHARAAAPTVPVPLDAAAIYAPATGQFLYADAARSQRAIASTTKMMTALVVLEHVHDLNAVLTYPDHHLDPDDSQIGLRPGERMTVRDLVIAMMLPSADDAAWDLASGVGHGSVARFIGWMNDAARRLRLRHTHFATPSGLDTPGNYSTAADLDRLAAYDLSHFPFFARVVRMAHATLATGPTREVSNLNLLVGAYPWITGVKTGHTAQAGWLLVASGRRHGLDLVADALGVQTDPGSDADALALLDYGYAEYAMRTPVHAGEVLARLPVADRPGLRVPVHAATSFRRVLDRHERVSLRVRAPRRLRGPLPARAVVGSAVVLEGSRAIDRVPLVIDRRLAAVSRLTLAWRFVTRPWVLVLIIVAASLGLVALLLAAARGGSGRDGGGGRGGRRERRERGRRGSRRDRPAGGLGPGFGA